MKVDLFLNSYPKVESLFEHPKMEGESESTFVTCRKSVLNSIVVQSTCNFRNWVLRNEDSGCLNYCSKRGVSMASGLFSIGASLFFGSIEVVARVAIGIITFLFLTLSSQTRVYRLVSDLGFGGAKTTFDSLLHGVKIGFQAMLSKHHCRAIESYRELKKEKVQRETPKL